MFNQSSVPVLGSGAGNTKQARGHRFGFQSTDCAPATGVAPRLKPSMPLNEPEGNFSDSESSDSASGNNIQESDEGDESGPTVSTWVKDVIFGTMGPRSIRV